MLHESAVRLVRDRPLDIFLIPLWINQGKAALKRHLSDRIEFSPSTLPYNEEFLEWLRQEHVKGRQIVLCTASDQRIATMIAA